MKPRPFAALVAVTALALLFAIVSYASNNRWAPAKISGTPLLPALGTQADKIAKIEIAQGGKILALARDKENWSLADRGNYPAKSESARALIVKLAEAQTIEPKTQNKDRFGLLDLEDPAAKDAKSRLVRLLDDKGAAVAEVIIGKKRFDAFGANKSGTYMRRPADTETWLTDADVDVAMNVRDWVRPQVLDLPTSKISSVTVEIPGEEPLKIAREGDKYALAGGVPKGRKLKDGANIDAIARAAGSIDLEDVRKLDGGGGEDAGIAKIEGEGGLAVTLKLRKRGADYWLSVAATGDGDSKAGAEEITRRTQGWEYKVPASKAEAILKRRADLTEFELKLWAGVMTVIPFKRPRSWRQPGNKIEPPAVLGHVGAASGKPANADEVDYRLRTQQNLAAVGVVIIIVVLGGWMIDQLRTYSRIRACFDVGHRNCMPLNIDPPGAR